MNTGLNPDRLLPLLREGEPRALETLCRETAGLTRASARRYLRSAEDIEEIVSDTFLRFHRSLPRFRGQCSVKTWLWHISGNLALNRCSYNRRRRQGDTVSLGLVLGDGPTTLADTLPAEDADPRDGVELTEFEGLVRGAVDRLPAKHGQILRLVVEDHLSYDQIAERLGLNPGTVKSRIARAREKLRQAMAA